MDRRAVFLDRDGVLNIERGHIAASDNISLISGAASAVKRLNDAGLLAIVVTNQSNVARGGLRFDTLAAINASLLSLLRRSGATIDGIYVCPHHPDPGPGGVEDFVRICDCRKPAPGLVLQAALDHEVDLARSWMIGDSTRDIEMARRVGLKSILVRTGHGGFDGEYEATANYIAADLTEAVELILANR